MKQLGSRSVAAGLLIGLAGCVFSACTDFKPVGAFLFSAGLLLIAATGQYLYTGKIGYWNYKAGTLKPLAIMLGLNLLAAFLTGFAAAFAKPAILESCTAITEGRLSQTPLQAFLSAVLCGALVYLAIYIFNRESVPPVIRMTGLILCVMTFVLSGYDHCIANAAYFGAALGRYPLVPMLVILLMDILGNSAGALALHQIMK